jgi:hypothetical protein
MFVGLALLAPVFAGPASAQSLSNTTVETRGQIELTQYREESRYCRRLRRACENKDVRGETGEGNCRRYRRECGRDR